MQVRAFERYIPLTPFMFVYLLLIVLLLQKPHLVLSLPRIHICLHVHTELVQYIASQAEILALK